MEKLTENQIEMRLLELSESLGYRKETIAWVWSAIGRASRNASLASNLSAKDVCCILVSEANETRGGSIEYILQLVGIPISEDVGKIVFGLVEKGLVYSKPDETISEFEGIYDVNNISNFIHENRIKRKRIKLPSVYTGVTWIFYITGVLLVFGSYVGWVGTGIAWIGWCVGMVGLAMHYFQPSGKQCSNNQRNSDSGADAPPPVR